MVSVDGRILSAAFSRSPGEQRDSCVGCKAVPPRPAVGWGAVPSGTSSPSCPWLPHTAASHACSLQCRVPPPRQSNARVCVRRSCVCVCVRSTLRRGRLLLVHLLLRPLNRTSSQPKPSQSASAQSQSKLDPSKLRQLKRCRRCPLHRRSAVTRQTGPRLLQPPPPPPQPQPPPPPTGFSSQRGRGSKRRQRRLPASPSLRGG